MKNSTFTFHSPFSSAPNVEVKGAVFHRLRQSSLHGTITSEGVHGIRPKVTSNAPFDLQADMGQIERSI